MTLNKTWHLANTQEEINLTEFELQLWRVYYGFIQWQEECSHVANNEQLSADELAVLHVIRMKDRPKTIADIGRLLNRDNFFSINYNIKKLIKLGLVKKTGKGNKKQYQYIVTNKGKLSTDNYTKARKNILIDEFRKDLNNINLAEITNGLMRLKGIYEEGMRIASSYSAVQHEEPTK